MVFCRSCNSSVGHEEIPTLRLRGKCTRCYLHSLPLAPLTPPIRMKAELAGLGGTGTVAEERRASCLTDEALVAMRREVELERVILIGVPSEAEIQRERLDAFEIADPQPWTLTLHESLAWQEEHGLVDGSTAAAP